MPRFRAAALLLLAFAAEGCSWGPEGGPGLLAVAPAVTPNQLDVELVLRGRNFESVAVVDFDRPRDSDVDACFAVALRSGPTRIVLGAVERLSASELHASVPAGTPPGTYDVEVRDPRGRVASLPAALLLYGQTAVTTAVDEADPGAMPTDPGGTGLSLREAVAWANAQPFPTTITLAAPLTLTMAGQQTDLTLTAPGVEIVGEPGVVLDFGGSVNQPCIVLGGPRQRLIGVTMTGCAGTFVQMRGTSAGSQVAQVTMVVTGAARRYWAYGIEASGVSATSRIGPGNDLSGMWIALKIDGAGYEIFGNTLWDNAVGARLDGAEAHLWQNVFTRQVKGGSNRGDGVELLTGPGPVEILHNVFDENGGSGVSAAAVASLTVRDNLFTTNGGFGLEAQLAGLAYDHNGYFGNVGGDVSAALATGLTDLLLDPLFVDAVGGDFHLLPTSPAIDAGVDTGLDVNGAAPGRFDGSAPDLGAFESP